MTTEITYTWPNGKEEVKYRRAKDSKEALKMIIEVLKLKSRHGINCPYSYRDVENE